MTNATKKMALITGASSGMDKVIAQQPSHWGFVANFYAPSPG